MKCPKCGSEDVMSKEYAGGKFLLCNSCGYDESLEVDVVPEENTNQKEKGRYSPYKSRLRSRPK